jgi:hypothetical protein
LAAPLQTPLATGISGYNKNWGYDSRQGSNESVNANYLRNFSNETARREGFGGPEDGHNASFEKAPLSIETFCYSPARKRNCTDGRMYWSFVKVTFTFVH